MAGHPRPQRLPLAGGLHDRAGGVVDGPEPPGVRRRTDVVVDDVDRRLHDLDDIHDRGPGHDLDDCDCDGGVVFDDTTNPDAADDHPTTHDDELATNDFDHRRIRFGRSY